MGLSNQDNELQETKKNSNPVNFLNVVSDPLRENTDKEVSKDPSDDSEVESHSLSDTP